MGIHMFLSVSPAVRKIFMIRERIAAKQPNRLQLEQIKGKVDVG